jgi:hypothetical protein
VFFVVDAVFQYCCGRLSFNKVMSRTIIKDVILFFVHKISSKISKDHVYKTFSFMLKNAFLATVVIQTNFRRCSSVVRVFHLLMEQQVFKSVIV